MPARAPRLPWQPRPFGPAACSVRSSVELPIAAIRVRLLGEVGDIAVEGRATDRQRSIMRSQNACTPWIPWADQ